MSLLSEIRKRARNNQKRIVLPEGDDARILKASDRILRQKIAQPIVIEKGKKIEDIDRMIDEFAEIRHEHKKDMQKDEIRSLFMQNTAYAAAMMVRLGKADGFVAGASHKTSEIARAALYCLSVDTRVNVMSGGFIIEIPRSRYGHRGAFVFSDCGIVPFPNAQQLAGIAVSAADFAQKVLNITPKVAMLSYSTKGSASAPDLDVIREAVRLAKDSRPDIEIDGELQVDAALDPEAAKIKHSISGSGVAGKANVLIFPNLDSGNIAYKLIQRLASARAVGPILLGLERPCSDLSRACTVEDIVDAVAVTALMAH